MTCPWQERSPAKHWLWRRYAVQPTGDLSTFLSLHCLLDCAHPYIELHTWHKIDCVVITSCFTCMSHAAVYPEHQPHDRQFDWLSVSE